MKKILSLVLAFAVCFTFIPFIGGSDFEADAATYSAPERVTVDWGKYTGAPS